MEGGYVVVHLHRDNEAFARDGYSMLEAVILFVVQVHHHPTPKQVPEWQYTYVWTVWRTR